MIAGDSWSHFGFGRLGCSKSTLGVGTYGVYAVGRWDLSVRLVGQVVQLGLVGHPIKVPVKKGFEDWLARLANACAARISFLVEVWIGRGWTVRRLSVGGLCGVAGPANGA